jgi:hypothetical protein
MSISKCTSYSPVPFESQVSVASPPVQWRLAVGQRSGDAGSERVRDPLGAALEATSETSLWLKLLD